jgi:hypothetical protein
MSASEQNEQFSDLFSNLCIELTSLNRLVYVTGDMNLDVRNYNKTPYVTDYVDLLFFMASCKQSQNQQGSLQQLPL